ncbi:MAG: cytochrome c [Acidimicrobiales bacterium]|nr:cytochrome c [Acidimicrobiales bacterium]MCB9394829.1 cytochrome c [Acidimicrobiaceae bacterium]
MSGSTTGRDTRRRLRWALFAGTVAAVTLTGGAFAQDASPDDTTATTEATEGSTSSSVPDENAVPDEVLRQGAEVFTQVCQSCHQPGGVGLSGKYPPLLDNPNTADAAYVETVIRNGREGEIVVNGETYDGVMPAQAALSDDQVSSVIAYIQSGFQAPAGGGEDAGASGPVAGTELPGFANMTILLAFAGALGVAGLAMAPRITGEVDRRTMPWLDAWMRTAIIVVGFIVFTVYVPAKVLESETVAKLDRPVQDIIGSGLWLMGLAGGLLALWYAHRQRRI